MRRLAYLAAALLTLGLLVLVVGRIRRDGVLLFDAPERAAPAPAAPTRAGREPFVGAIVPRQQVDVSATVEARVVEMRVALGTRVAKGDVIATLDAESLRRELAAAAAAVRGAEAEVRTAQIEHGAASEKARRLEEYKDAVPGEELVNAALQRRTSAARVAGARARVAEANARLEQLELLVERAAVVAPFDGVVSARYVDAGAQVGPGKPLVRVISADDLWVRFAVPEERAGEVGPGSCVLVSTTSPVKVTGVVRSIAPQVDSELRLLFAEARLVVPAAAHGRIQAGLAAEVSVRACTTP